MQLALRPEQWQLWQRLRQGVVVRTKTTAWVETTVFQQKNSNVRVHWCSNIKTKRGFHSMHDLANYTLSLRQLHSYQHVPWDAHYTSTHRYDRSIKLTVYFIGRRLLLCEDTAFSGIVWVLVDGQIREFSTFFAKYSQQVFRAQLCSHF